MKKIAAIIFFLFMLSLNIYGGDIEENINDIESRYETVELDIATVFSEIFSFKEILKNTLFLAGVSLFGAFFSGKHENGALKYAVSAATVGIIAFPVIDAFTSLKETVSVFSSFLTASAPVFFAISVSAGKGVSGGVSYGFTMLLCSVISAFSSGLLLPVVSSYTALGSVCAVSDTVDLKAFCDFIYKGAVLLLSVFALVFTSFFIIKSKVAASGDSVLLRGMKFTVSSAFPVVGSALSDAIATASGYLTGLKSGFSLFGIGVLTAAFLPTMGKTLMWIITLSVSSAVSGVFGEKRTQRLLSGIRGSFTLMWSIAALFYFMAFVLIINITG